MDKTRIYELIREISQDEETNNKKEWKKDIKFFLTWILALFSVFYGVSEIKTVISTSSTAASSAGVDSKIDNNNPIKVNNYLGHLGLSEVRITGEFGSAIQACWFYQSTYRNLHPYTVLWEISGENEYPKIRVIAKDIIWDAHTCITQKGNPNGDKKEITKLIGDDSLTHRIEAKMRESEEYQHIADAKAYYRSVLHFDDKGRIVHRKIKRAEVYNYSFPDSLHNYLLQDSLPEKNYRNKILKCEAKDTEEEKLECRIVSAQSESPKNLGVDYNNVIITDPPTAGESPFNKFGEDYVEAIVLYVEKRTNLHNNLAKDGCVAISVEPTSQESILSNNGDKNVIYLVKQPSIIFMCHKRNEDSHIRAIVRESYEEKKKREKI